MLGYLSEFDIPWYRSQFAEAIRQNLGGEAPRVDAVAFGSPEPFSVAVLACLTEKAEKIAAYLGPSDENAILRMAQD